MRGKGNAGCWMRDEEGFLTPDYTDKHGWGEDEEEDEEGEEN